MNPNNKDNKVNKEIIIPDFETFKNFALEKEPLINIQYLKHKYDSWIVNDWKTGKDKPIKNWKSTLLNTLQYLEKDKPKPIIYEPKYQDLTNYQYSDGTKKN